MHTIYAIPFQSMSLLKIATNVFIGYLLILQVYVTDFYLRAGSRLTEPHLLAPSLIQVQNIRQRYDILGSVVFFVGLPVVTEVCKAGKQAGDIL
jgi:hypothetical protein